MSFSGTPLGQGRRLDHSTFLGKPTSDSTNSVPSYAYGAPALGSRSPPKPTSPLRDRNRSQTHENDATNNESEPALVRFARLKQRETAPVVTVRPGGPKVITSPPHPEKWSVKDTSVNIATAFIQAASSDMSTYNQNNSWASTSSRAPPVPRSTSVEFESSAPATASGPRRLAPPPNKLSRPPLSSQGRKPPSKSSILVVPDSEDEEGRNVRGKSPFELGMNMAKQAIGAAAFYVRQRSHEPENLSREQAQDQSHEQPSANGRADGNESSYSYREEETAFLANKKAARKARMSVDNKAYKPSKSDDEYSEYSSDDGKPSKRRKSTKGGYGGLLTSLPVVGNSKKRRRQKKTANGAKGVPDGGPDEFVSGSEEEDSVDVSTSTILHASMMRDGSVPPAPNVPLLRVSQEPHNQSMDNSTSMTQGLESIAEVPEEQHLGVESLQPKRQVSQQRRSRSRTPGLISTPSRSPAFSIGGFLGSIVHFVARFFYLVITFVFSIVTASGFLIGQVLGKTFDIILRRPVGWARGSSPLMQFLIPGALAFLAWYILHDAPLSSYVPSLSFPTRSTEYQAPDMPPVDLGEFSTRLLRIESTLTGLSADNQRTKLKTEESARSSSELLGRISSLENRLSLEMKKVHDAEARAQDAVSRTIGAIKQEMEILSSQIAFQQKQQEKNQRTPSGGIDEEARTTLRAFEERFAGLENSAKEALELGKKALSATPPPAASPAPASGWWTKPGVGTKSDLTIKSVDGQDVTALITHLVDNAVSRVEKDSIAKADFAMHSAGARVIPSLTSPDFELKPKGLGNQIMGLFTGKGYFGFQPPITALHYDTHAGRCWPFAGTEGQLGVMLVSPVYIEEITIDHIAKEVAFDMETAPKHMDVWGLVEGADNLKRLEDWKADRAARKEAGEAEAEGDEGPYPPTLPKDAEYIRLADFTYDIDALNNVQTFPVDPEIRNLGIDFGVVVLRVLDNWGRKEYTCLYRFRVHGQKMGGITLPHTEDS